MFSSHMLHLSHQHHASNVEFLFCELNFVPILHDDLKGWNMMMNSKDDLAAPRI